ncbi:hypothetical protein [Roseomonas populi]|uniref:Uncharacterized protein n=1 Tax=Roseomonas populi TaxID=3121582 RepID=A0ABT1X1H9_9PROT|nr:hypothetical protein [Roseomonas pecuniae]MCR0981960.1 hypothetical protein [Roseomonas pecuniae]
MRKLALGLFVLSLLIGGARLFTGVIYLSDEPTAILVLKREPAMWIERPEARDRPLPEQIVLDRDEPSLAYGRLYVPLMRAAPALAPVLAGAAVLLLAISVRRRARTRR